MSFDNLSKAIELNSNTKIYHCTVGGTNPKKLAYHFGTNIFVPVFPGFGLF